MHFTYVVIYRLCMRGRECNACAEHSNCVSQTLASLVPQPHVFIRDIRKHQVDIALKYEYHKNGTDDRNQDTHLQTKQVSERDIAPRWLC